MNFMRKKSFTVFVFLLAFSLLLSACGKSNTKEDTKEDIRNKCLFELIYSTGIRVSEVSNIKISDIIYLRSSNSTNCCEKNYKTTGSRWKQMFVCVTMVSSGMCTTRNFISEVDYEYDRTEYCLF